jgi:ABC-type uncharacterized transport system substrate-binding protein
VIASSPTDTQPVFDAIVRSAARVCDGLYCAAFRFDGELLHRVAHHNFSPAAAEAVKAMGPIRLNQESLSTRAILERVVVHVSDVEQVPEARATRERAEIVPRLSRVAVLGDSAEPGHAQELRETEGAARTLRVQLRYLDVDGANDIETAFRAARTGRADAVLTLTSALLFSNRTRVVDLAGKSRLPVMYFSASPGFAAGGGLMSYGASPTDMDRRAATFVDKILKGAKPADLPIEQPTKFEFIINLKAAKQIGLTIPPAVLARADEVIQ